MMLKQLWPDLTHWGLLVRKDSIQLQRDVLMSRSLCFVVNLEGMTVLNAGLKSTNSIHACELLLFKCVSKMCSTVDPLCSRVKGPVFVEGSPSEVPGPAVWSTSLQWVWVLLAVIQVCFKSVSAQHNRGGFEARRHSCLGDGQVNPSELVSTCPEHASRNTIGAQPCVHWSGSVHGGHLWVWGGWWSVEVWSWRSSDP